MDLTLITGRTINQGRGTMTDRLGTFHQRISAVIQMNGQDLRELGLGERGLVRVTSSFGEVVLKAEEAEEELPRGLAYMPYGPWASRLVGSDTGATGMPSFKGMKVKVQGESAEDIKPATSLGRVG